jgi:hypothetical protein
MQSADAKGRTPHEMITMAERRRLTRLLADSAKIVEIFNARDASFVSVTQQSRTTSIGRLTLNVVLSFAQFEREIIGERIRDKLAASKRKGMWMGGVPPLGHRVQCRKLDLIDSEAEIVRFIFHRYAKLGSVRLLKEELDARRIKSKSWTSASGRPIGGRPLSRGALYLLLQNRRDDEGAMLHSASDVAVAGLVLCPSGSRRRREGYHYPYRRSNGAPARRAD